MLYLINKKKNEIHGPQGIIHLTEKEMRLFLLLIKDNYDTQSIINKIWQKRADVINQNTLSQLSWRLRNKLKQANVPFIFSISMVNGIQINRIRRCYFLQLNSSRLLRLMTGLFQSKDREQRILFHERNDD